jgi:hypothetical protein
VSHRRAVFPLCKRVLSPPPSPQIVSKTCCIRVQSLLCLPPSSGHVVFLRVDCETQISPHCGRPACPRTRRIHYYCLTPRRCIDCVLSDLDMSRNGVLRSTDELSLLLLCDARAYLSPLTQAYRPDGTWMPYKLVAYPNEARPAIVAMC